jgi:hypothetical protein
MPNYYSWEDFGLRVNIRDQNKWKTIFHNYTYYYIGDIVRLVISIEQTSINAPNFADIRIAEKVPSSKEYAARKIGPQKRGFTNVVFAIQGDVLDESGDDVWRLEIHKEDSVKIARKIFDAGIVNRDMQRRDNLTTFLAIMAILISLISCIVASYLGYLQLLHK